MPSAGKTYRCSLPTPHTEPREDPTPTANANRQHNINFSSREKKKLGTAETKLRDLEIQHCNRTETYFHTIPVLSESLVATMRTHRPRKPPFLLSPPATSPFLPRYGHTAPTTSTSPPALLPTDTTITGGLTHPIHMLLLTVLSTPTFQDDHSLNPPPCQTPYHPHPPAPRLHPSPTNLLPPTTHTLQQTCPTIGPNQSTI